MGGPRLEHPLVEADFHQIDCAAGCIKIERKREDILSYFLFIFEWRVAKNMYFGCFWLTPKPNLRVFFKSLFTCLLVSRIEFDELADACQRILLMYIGSKGRRKKREEFGCRMLVCLFVCL